MFLKKNYFVDIIDLITVEDLILVFVQTLVCKFRFGSRCRYVLFVRTAQCEFSKEYL